MSRVISLFVGFVCALLFVNVYAQSEFSILSPDGSYKHDSALVFTKVLKKLEDFTLPFGDVMLEKWIAAVKALNEALNAGDMKASGQVGHGAIQVLRGLLPAIPDNLVHAAIEELANRLEKDLDSYMIAGTTSLADTDKIFQFAASSILSAMSQGTPTAETLA